jgi:hypothetical protein
MAENPVRGTWERTPTIEEMAHMEAGHCVCACGASVTITVDGWARCKHSEGHEFRLKSVNGEPMLVYRWNSERDLMDHIRSHNRRKSSLGFSHDCELHRSLDPAQTDGSDG